MEIDKTLTKKADSIYTGKDTKQTYRLVSVDRDYTCKKKPVYYLQKLENGKAHYLSGMFRTSQENKFSFDLKDSLGIKQYFTLEFTDNGTQAKITKGKTK